MITGTDIIPVGALFLGIVLKRAVAAGAAVTVDIGIAEDADRFFDNASLNATGDVKLEASFNQFDIGGEQLVVTASGGLLASDAEVKLFYLVP